MQDSAIVVHIKTILEFIKTTVTELNLETTADVAHMLQLCKLLLVE